MSTIARLAAPVLVEGETGTGKEVVASALHEASGRPGRFVGVNCAALSEELVESELFGHARGAFSGSTGSRAGLFRTADRGTLLLDEIGELPQRLQAKLLRVIETGEVRSVGDENLRGALELRGGFGGGLAAMTGDENVDVAAQRLRGGEGFRGRRRERGVRVFGEQQDGHQSTPASDLSFETSSATDPTLTPAERVAGSAVFTTSRRGEMSTP